MMNSRFNIILIVQLATSHVLTVILIWLLFFPDSQSSITLAIGVAVIVGLLLTANIQLNVSRLYRILGQLNQMRSTKPLSMLPFDPLSPLVRRANQFLARDVDALRETLIHQTREAAAQEERNRMARELHDSIKQQLFVINISVAAATARLENDLEGAKSSLADVRLSVKEAMAEMNAMLQQLSPVPLEKVGLSQALRDQSDALSYRTGAVVTVDIADLPDDQFFPVGAQDILFRVAQEALNNIARHARAKNVTLRLSSDSEYLRLDITDDGQGFNVDTTLGGMGLSNMRERLQAVAGQLQLNSRPRTGTTIRASIPLVDSLVLQETIMSKIDHTINRIFLVGLLGGFCLIATLYIPLYRFLPSQIVPDWSETNRFIVLLSTLASLAVMLLTGFAAARFGKGGSRAANMAYGGIAGGVASVLAFFAIGAATAGVIGNRVIFGHGLVAASNETHFDQLIVDSIAGSVWWSYGMFWVALLGGIGLGVFGTLTVAPSPDATPISWRAIRGWLPAMVTLGGLTLIIQTLIFSMLQSDITEHTHQSELSETVLRSHFSLFPIVTIALGFFIPLAVLVYMQRADLRSQQPDRLSKSFVSGLTVSVIAALVMLIFWLVSKKSEEDGLSLTTTTLIITTLTSGFILWLLIGCYQAGKKLRSLTNEGQSASLRGGIIILISLCVVVILLLSAPLLIIAILAGAMIGNLYGKRVIARLQPYRRTSVIIGLIALLTVDVFSLTTTIFIVSFVASFVAEIHSSKWSQERRGKTAAVAKRIQEQLGMVLGTIVMMVFMLCLGLIAVLPIVVISIPSITPLSQYDASTEPVSVQTTLAEMTRDLYFAHAEVLIVLFIIIFILVGLVALMAFVINYFMTRRSRQTLVLTPAT